MIFTSEFAPLPALAPFVHSFIYREFETFGEEIIKPWHASPQANIIFFLKALPIKLTDQSGRIVKTGKSCDVVGMSTRCNGEMAFKGSYAFFQILFEPNGFYRIFKRTSLEIADKIIWSEDLFKSDIRFLHEQFFETDNILRMIQLANAWLLSFLNKQPKVNDQDRITSASHLISKRHGLISIQDLAKYACMSPRNFERTFLFETGMSPKQLCCIVRFNSALDLKSKFPLLNWTAIAHQAGYFDQTHLIKDFKKFCGHSPFSLLKDYPLYEEEFLSQL